MSVKVILRSPEAIKLFLAKYFDGKEFKLDVTGEVTLEQEETDIAIDVFKLLLKENLVSAEHVEFLNITPNSTTTEIEVQETSQEKQNSGASRGKERRHLPEGWQVALGSPFATGRGAVARAG